MDDINPYRAPDFIGTLQKTGLPANRLASVGFAVAACGLVTAFVVVPALGNLVPAEREFDARWWLIAFAICLCPLAPVGAIISAIAAFAVPRRLALWGIAFGILGSMMLPAYFFLLTVSIERGLERQQVETEQSTSSQKPLRP